MKNDMTMVKAEIEKRAAWLERSERGQDWLFRRCYGDEGVALFDGSPVTQPTNGRRFIPSWLAAERERCMAVPMAGLQHHTIGGFVDFDKDATLVRHMRGVRIAREIMRGGGVMKTKQRNARMADYGRAITHSDPARHEPKPVAISVRPLSEQPTVWSIFTVDVAVSGTHYSVRLMTKPGAAMVLSTRTPTGRKPMSSRRADIERAALEAVML